MTLCEHLIVQLKIFIYRRELVMYMHVKMEEFTELLLLLGS